MARLREKGSPASVTERTSPDFMSSPSVLERFGRVAASS
jgi:hypothetical protein